MQQMTARISSWILVLALAFLTACASTDQDKFDQQVRKWVPLGTSATEAKRIMESHDFECTLLKKDSPFNHHGTEALECERSQKWLHTWTTVIYLTDDKVTGYGETEIESYYHSN
jgi:L-alanine-DL-glutamate epimerase-like enolase superfamily enzyme